MRSLLHVLSFLFISSISWSQNLTADFTANLTEVCVGDLIQFADLSTQGNSPIVSWNWDFGDGNASTDQNPTHNYTIAGSYNVILTVQDQDGSADPEVKTGYILVNPLPEVDFFLQNQACSTPFNANFVNNSSAGAQYTYAWEFGNGQTSSTYTPSGIIYTSSGNYDVSLELTNTNTGCVNEETVQISVVDFSLTMSSPDTICLSELLQVSSTASPSADTWSWDFGDGTNSNTSTAVHMYSTAGTYTVSLSATHTGSGCTSTLSQDLVVLESPIIAFTATPISGCNPLTVDFVNNSTGASTYQWDLGDGTTYQGNAPPPHTYTSSTEYDILLTGENSFGCTTSLSVLSAIEVEDLEVHVTASVYEGCDPLSVAFNYSTQGYNPVYDSIVSWQWDFDNGNTFSGESPPSQTYNFGTYSPSLTVTTASGCIASFEMTDTLVEVGLIDSLEMDFIFDSLCAGESVLFNGTAFISVPHNPNDVDYVWNFSDNTTALGSNTPVVFELDTGYISVQLTATYRGCSMMIEMDSVVYVSGPISIFSNQYLFCNPSSIPIDVDFTDYSIHGDLADDVFLTWDFGDTTGLDMDDPELDDTDLGSTTHTYDNYGTFYINQVIHNYDTGCSDSSTRVLHITYTDAMFTYSNDSLCLGESIVIDDSSTTSPPHFVYLSDTILNYYYTGTSQVLWGQNHVFEYPASGSYELIHYAINNLGCSDYDTLNVVVLEPGIADIVASTVAGCAPLEVSFTNASSVQGNGVPFDYFIWEFDDGSITTTNSTSTSVLDTFYLELPYLTTLTGFDVFGCQSNIASVIVDVTKPSADFVLDSVFCNQVDFTAINTSFGNVPLSYEWFMDGSSVSFSTDLNETINETILYGSVPHEVALLTTDVNGCTDTVYQDILVSLPQAVPNFSFSGASTSVNGEYDCPPVFANFTDTSFSIGSIESWQWNFGNTNTSILENPQTTYVFAGTYSLSLSIEDEYGCVDDTLLTDYLVVNGPSGEPLWTNIGSSCDPVYEFIVENQSGVVQLYWDLDDGTILQEQSEFTHVYDTSGVYSPTVILSDGMGCDIPYQLEVLDHHHNEIEAFFTPSMLQGEVSEIFVFDDQSFSSAEPLVSWSWDNGESSFVNSTDVDAEVFWNYTGSQTMTLTVADSNGCMDTYSIDVWITANFNIPNVFTPNGDGINDFFELDFDVFNGFDYFILNRWGNVVTQGRDHNGTILWDGRTNSGEMCSEGTYFYKVSGELYDGTKIVKHGHVTINY